MEFITITIFALMGGFAILLIVFFMYISYMSGREKKVDSRTAFLESNDIMERAQIKANQLIQDAVGKAENTLLQADYLKADLMQNFEKSLGDLAGTITNNLTANEKGFQDAFEKFADSIRAEYVKKVDETLNSIKTQAQKDVSDFQGVLKQETVDSQMMLRKKIMEQFDHSLLEIQEYKRGQLSLIDSSIENVLKRISQDIFGRALTFDQHEQLIIDALEQAKREEFFQQGLSISVPPVLKPPIPPPNGMNGATNGTNGNGMTNGATNGHANGTNGNGVKPPLTTLKQA